MNNNQARVLLAILLGGMVFLACFGLFLTSRGLAGVWRGHQTLSWPETMGTIKRWQVNRYLSRPVVTRINVECEYEYIVGGRRLVGHNIASWHVSKNDIYEIASHVFEGRQHPVYYNPENPTDAVLIRGSHCANTLMGLMFFLGPSIVLYGVWKSRSSIMEQFQSK